MWIAQATATGGYDLTSWGQFGIFLTAIAALATFARQAYNQAVADRKAEREENQRLNQVILDKVIPALESATLALREVSDKNIPALNASSEALKEAAEALRDFRRGAR